MKIAVAILCVLGLALAQEFKSLSGPVSEFPNFVLPNPIEGALVSSSTSYDIELSSTQTTEATWTQSFQVDGQGLFSISVISPIESKLTILVKQPSSATFVAISSLASEIISDSTGVDGATFPTTSYVFNAPTLGIWVITISADTAGFSAAEKTRYVDSSMPEGIIIVGNPGQYQSFAHVTSYAQLLGNNIGLQVRLFDSLDAATQKKPKGWAPKAITAGTLSANAYIVEPNGNEVDLPMYDDGLHSDAAANDGIFGVAVTIGDVGYYQARVTLQGFDPAGNPLSRSTDHLFFAVADTLDLPGTGSAVANDDTISLYVDAKMQTFPNISAPPAYKVYGELWGADAQDGTLIPIAWIGGMSPLITLNGATVLALEVDMQWIHRAGATGPFRLENFRAQDKSSSIPLDLATEIFISTATEDLEKISKARNPLADLSIITSQMRWGKAPARIAEATARAMSGAEDGKLVLLHGYCAASNPWPTADFPDGVFYSHGSAVSQTHDQYANDVVAFLKANNITSASGIGHSQGGPVLTHILNYYWSAFDVTITLPGYAIQSVGSPYMGCSMAGGLANVGGIFGVGCGSNSDLSRDGALLWASGISPATREEVYYYTTTFGSTSPKYCNFAVNLVSHSPNDGTTELDWAQLEGANNLGNTEEWCHIDEMSWPVQTSDHSRNAKMNAASVF